MGAWIMAGVTFREAARRKILWTALLAGSAFLALFGTGMHFQAEHFTRVSLPPFVRYQVLSTMLQVGFYAVDLLAVIMTILTSVDALSGEIASGTIQAIATKPIPRWQVLIGKWMGFAGMAFMFGTWFSTLTNGVIVLGLHGLAFIGGWIEQIGAATDTPRLVTVGVVSSLIMPSESVWRRASFEMQSSFARSLRFSPFSEASAPSAAMVGYAIAYLLVALVVALYHFHRRDL